MSAGPYCQAVGFDLDEIVAAMAKAEIAGSRTALSMVASQRCTQSTTMLWLRR